MSNLNPLKKISVHPGNHCRFFIFSLLSLLGLPGFAEENTVMVSGDTGYNAWPMVASSRGLTVCVYSRGARHDIGDPIQNIYSRTSDDQGKTWSEEFLVSAQKEYGETATGKGVDENGAMLFWVRCFIQNTPTRHHELYRTTDGRNFEKIAIPRLNPEPMQITDIINIPGVGLAAMWFENSYKPQQKDGSWGMIFSRDNGKSWRQTVIESGLLLKDIPLEQAMLSLGSGKLLMLSRLNDGKNQTQFISSDAGKSWEKLSTNIDDMKFNTPTMLLDPETGLISCYYYLRGRGELVRRTIDAARVFTRPAEWSASETIARGSKIQYDAGNANMTQADGKHLIVFYSGKSPNTAIFSATADAPKK